MVSLVPLSLSRIQSHSRQLRQPMGQPRFGDTADTFSATLTPSAQGLVGRIAGYFKTSFFGFLQGSPVSVEVHREMQKREALIDIQKTKNVVASIAGEIHMKRKHYQQQQQQLQTFEYEIEAYKELLTETVETHADFAELTKLLQQTEKSKQALLEKIARDEEELFALEMTGLERKSNLLARQHDYEDIFESEKQIRRDAAKANLAKYADLGNMLSSAMPAYLANDYLSHAASLVTDLMRANDHYYEVFEASTGHHDAEAEIMLLMRHPRIFEPEQASNLAQLVQGLTSVTHFINHGVFEVSNDMVRAWSDIGALSLGFRHYKFDARGGADSLLTKYGFKEQSYGADQKIFVLNQSGERLLALQRGFVLVSCPGMGTLVIRNSSPEYGRDKMPHPAYYSAEVLTEADLKSLEPDKDKRFAHILTPAIYKRLEFENKLKGLLSEVTGWKEDYRKFKLDIDSRDEDGNFNGDLQPGFETLVNTLLEMPPQKRPALAFVDPDYPPYVPYSFETRTGETPRYFELTPDQLEELVARVNGTWSSRKYPQSDWVRFIEGGLSHQRSELALLDLPEKLKTKE